jgi:hypothetical protein
MANIFTGGIKEKIIRIPRKAPNDLERAVNNLRDWYGYKENNSLRNFNPQRFVTETLKIADKVLYENARPSFLTNHAVVIFNNSFAVEYTKFPLWRLSNGILSQSQYSFHTEGNPEDEIAISTEGGIWIDKYGQINLREKKPSSIEFIKNDRAINYHSLIDSYDY